MGEVVKFPDRFTAIEWERSVVAQRRMEEIMGEFDEQFQVLYQRLLDACDDLPDEYLMDPIYWGNGYATLLVGAGVNPHDLIGFQQISELCEEFGFEFKEVECEDGSVLYEFLPEEDEDE